MKFKAHTSYCTRYFLEQLDWGSSHAVFRKSVIIIVNSQLSNWYSMPSKQFWATTRWEYLGWSNINWNQNPQQQITIYSRMGRILSILEKHSPVSDWGLYHQLKNGKESPISIKVIRERVETLEKIGLIKPIPKIGPNLTERHDQISSVDNLPVVIQHLSPSHFIDAGFLTKGKVKSHNRKKLGVVVVAVVEVQYEGDKRSRGRKFAYVFPGKSDRTDDLIKAMDLTRKHQRVSCIQTDKRPLYNSKKFKAYLSRHRIQINMTQKFGVMGFIDGMFGQWKAKFVHPNIKEIEAMNVYDRFEYTVQTLQKCFPDMIIETPSVEEMLRR
jgi:hypothetical protein